MNHLRNRRRDNFFYLLAGLLVLIVIGPILATLLGELSTLVMEFSFSIMLLVSLWSLHASRRWFVIGSVLVGLNLAFTGGLVFGFDRLAIAAMLSGLCFLSITVWVAAKQVFRADRIDLNTVVGAVCVYLLLGVIWTILYRFLGDVAPGSLSGLDQYEGEELYWRYLYFSFVTLTTLGYGDISPVNAYRETLAILEAVVGQMYLTVLVAGLVGAYLSDRVMPQPPTEASQAGPVVEGDGESPRSANHEDAGTMRD